MDPINKITYLKGDATSPENFLKNTSIASTKPQLHVVMHVCNDANYWGKGFVLALSDRWPALKQIYHANSKELGTGLLVKIDNGLIVYNMIAQHGIRNVVNIPPIRYEALQSCLDYLLSYLKLCNDFEVRIHAPRIGCGLAGGKWSVVEGLIQRTLVDNGYGVYVYDP